MTDAHIVGWGHTRFGRLDGRSIEDLIVEAARQAITHAGIGPEDVDAIFVGNYNSGLIPDGFISSMALSVDEGLRFKPATRLENACASGSAAVYAARDAIRSGSAKTVLVVGAEKMTLRDTAGVTASLASASYQAEEGGVSFPQVFARFAQSYFQANGDHSTTLAQIAAKNHLNAMQNPLAHMHKPLDVAFCNTVSERNPMIAAPLRMSDCSLISDGAAAMIMVADDASGDNPNAVAFRSAVQVNDYLPMSRRDVLAFEGPAEAFRRAFAQAGITVHDLDFAEVHDCFTIAELMIYEAMGLAPKGRGRQAVDNGFVMADGSLPINLSGGLKAKGHPIGATGVSMHVLAAMQLVNQAGGMQRKDAALGCVFNMGGSAGGKLLLHPRTGPGFLMNLANWLERAAHLHPESPALLHGKTIVADYAEFYRRSRAIAGAFRSQYGIAAGDRVALFMHNATEYLEALYATLLLGAVIVPINVKLHPREAAWIVNDAAANLIVSSGEQRDGLQAQPEAAEVPVIDAASDEWKLLYEAAPVERPVRRGCDDIAWIFYTSGTTGRPKGVMQTHGNLQATSLAYLSDVDAAEASDCALYAAPMSHGAGSYNFVFTLRAARHVVPPSGGFDPAEIQDLAPKLRNVCMFAAPTMVRRMVSHARQTGFGGDGLKTVVYGGGPMYVADILDAVDVLGPRFVQIYGQAESPMTITALSRERVADRNHPRWRERLGSVGAPHACVEVKIVDAEGNDLPCGEIGEVVVSGATVMAGYWRNERATADAIRDGWLWTGDLGSMDEDGFVTLSDRSKDMIISGGSNIYPREVEEVLLTHPSVAQVSVVGKPDREWGEVVIAFVVPEPGHPEDSGALDRHCITNIARFKRPKQYVYLGDLPKNAYGKVLKTELRKLLDNEPPREP